MSQYTVFPNAPITEALLDIRVELPKKIALSNLESFHDHIKQGFPEKQERISVKAGIKLSPEGAAVEVPAHGPDG